MARCSGREHPRGTTFALRMNGRTRFVSLRYCGSKTSISPNFVCQRSFFYLGDASKVVDEFLSRSLSPGSRPIPASPLALTAAFPRQSALRSRRPPRDFPPNSLRPWRLRRIPGEDQVARQELPKPPRRSVPPPPYAKPPS